MVLEKLFLIVRVAAFSSASGATGVTVVTVAAMVTFIKAYPCSKVT